MAQVESGEVRKTEGERTAKITPGSGRNQETMSLFGLVIPHQPPRLGHLDSCHNLADSSTPQHTVAHRPHR